MTLILAFLLATTPLPCTGAGQSRSKTAVKDFKAQWSKANGGIPCPTTCAVYIKRSGHYKVYEECGACEVDHICPLACCGLDAPQNMQWLDAKVNNAKGADCTKCAPAKK
jgi:hypothetical protein